MASKFNMYTADGRALIAVNGVDRLAINEDGSLELLTPPSVAQEANDLVTAGSKLQRGTAQTVSGTFKDFTGIPSWAKRVTVIFNGVSTNGASPLLVRIGSGAVDSSGYYSSGNSADGGVGVTTSTTGMVVRAVIPAAASSLLMTLVNVGGNTWVSSHAGTVTGASCFGGGTKTLPGPIDRVRITTESGTDTFDAGSVNIMLE